MTDVKAGLDLVTFLLLVVIALLLEARNRAMGLKYPFTSAVAFMAGAVVFMAGALAIHWLMNRLGW
jgi:hypothetical protein